MPIPMQSEERKKYCPRVFEVFGEYLDTEIFRCDYSTKELVYEANKYSFYHQCAAEFCYAKNPLHDDIDEQWCAERTPFNQTINLEVINDEYNIINVMKAKYGDAVRCKFCRYIVATVVGFNTINFHDVDSFLIPTDFNESERTMQWMMYHVMNNFNKEENRRRNIPLMIKKYKEQNGIPENLSVRKTEIINRVFGHRIEREHCKYL